MIRTHRVKCDESKSLIYRYIPEFVQYHPQGLQSHKLCLCPGHQGIQWHQETGKLGHIHHAHLLHSPYRFKSI